MAKIVKSKRRKLRLRGLALLLLIFSSLAWLTVRLYTNTTNAKLTMKIQEMNEELNELQAQNQSLNFEIQTLQNKDRVYEIASTANMNQIADNIISLVGE